jgi:hypothetical protein
MQNSILLKLCFSVTILFTVLSCSQNRITPSDVKGTGTEKIVDFNVVYNYNVMESLLKTQQKYTVNSITDLPIKTKKGTSLWIYDYNLKTANGQVVKYPFDVDIIELYTLKDMVLYNKPTMSGDLLLSTAGAIYINPSQNQVALKIGEFPRFDMPTAQTDPNMTIFYEIMTDNERRTWRKSDFRETNNKQQEGIFFTNKQAYQIFPSQYGWINCDKFYNFLGEKVKIEFKSTYPEIKNMMIFMVMPRISSVMGVYSGMSGEIPAGETVKIVAVAKSTEGEFYSYFTEIISEKNKIVELKLTETTEAEFLGKLDKI